MFKLLPIQQQNACTEEYMHVLNLTLAVKTNVPTGWFSWTVSEKKYRAANVGVNSLISTTVMNTSQNSLLTAVAPPSAARTTRLQHPHTHTHTHTVQHNVVVVDFLLANGQSTLTKHYY